MGTHLTMQPTLTALELNTFQKNKKIHRKQKYYNKYLYNTSIGFNNAKIFSITKKVKIKKIFCVICGKYRKFKKPKISYIFEKTLVISNQ